MFFNRFLSIILGVLFLSLAVALWAMPTQTATTNKTMPTTRVVVEQVKKVHTQRAAAFSGVTRAKQRAVLSFSVPARVIERLVDSGSQVLKGDVLARLDSREFRNAVNLARASQSELRSQWEQAGRDRRRFAKLAADDVVTVSDLEKVTTRETALEASLQAATARLKEAQRRLGESVLRAPFDGTVTGLYIQPGEWAVPGQAAIELTGEGDVELLVEVPETIVTRLSSGQKVQIQLPFAGDRRVSGRIGAVAKSAISAGRLFPVKVDVAAEPGITAGMTARLLVDLATEGALTIPLSAVVNPGASQPYIFIYHQGRVAKRPVTVEGVIQDRIIIHGDIAEGDQVVTAGQSQLADGDDVEVAL